jgi:hypothetical protein
MPAPDRIALSAPAVALPSGRNWLTDSEVAALAAQYEADRASQKTGVAFAGYVPVQDPDRQREMLAQLERDLGGVALSGPARSRDELLAHAERQVVEAEQEVAFITQQLAEARRSVAQRRRLDHVGQQLAQVLGRPLEAVVRERTAIPTAALGEELARVVGRACDSEQREELADQRQADRTARAVVGHERLARLLGRSATDGKPTNRGEA